MRQWTRWNPKGWTPVIRETPAFLTSKVFPPATDDEAQLFFMYACAVGGKALSIWCGRGRLWGTSNYWMFGGGCGEDDIIIQKSDNWNLHQFTANNIPHWIRIRVRHLQEMFQGNLSNSRRRFTPYAERTVVENAKKGSYRQPGSVKEMERFLERMNDRILHFISTKFYLICCAYCICSIAIFTHISS